MTVITHQSSIEWHDLHNGFGSSVIAESLPQPVDVLRKYGTHAASTDEVVAHTARMMPPPNELIRAKSLSVVTPERALAGMANTLNLPHAVAMIDEVCGTYRRLRKPAVTRYLYTYPTNRVHFYPKESNEITCQRATIYGLKPLTNIGRVSAFVDAHPGLSGVRTLRRALPFCVDGLRSYLETQYHMCSFMPPRWGGCGVTPPCVNLRIDIPPHLQKIANKPYIIADNAWPKQRVAVELLGASDHGGDGITETSVREKIYKELGWICITVTWQEMQDIDSFMLGMRDLTRELGERLRMECKDFSLRQQWLFDELRFRKDGTPPNRKSYKEYAIARYGCAPKIYGARHQ